MIARLALAENVVYLDHVPFKKEYYQHRTKLNGPNGFFWTGLPINRRNRGQQLYETALATNTSFALTKMKSSVAQFYRQSPHFDHVYPPLESLLDEFSRTHPTLSVCAERTISFFFDMCELQPPRFLRSHKTGEVPVNRSEMVLTLAKKVGATKVLNGFGGSKDVHDADMIEEQGVVMSFMPREVCDPYPNGLSYLHFLFWYGPDHFCDFIDEVRKEYEREA